jgi:hypothetical protein
VLRDIQPGPSEHKLGVRITQIDIYFQDLSDLSVAEVSSWTQKYPTILHSGAWRNIHRSFMNLVSDPGNTEHNYQRSATRTPQKCRKEQRRALFRRQ